MELRDTLEAKLRPLLGTVLQDSVAHAGRFRFHKGQPQQLTAVCIYSTLIELAHGTQVLLNAGDMGTSQPVLLRSIFEAYADLLAVLADGGYTDRMYATFLKEKQRLLKHALGSPENAFLAPFQAEMDVQAELRSIGADLKALQRKGKKPLETPERFNAAKLNQEYQSIYWLLCLASHNNMSALDDRHIEKRGETFDVVLFKGDQPADTLRIVDSLLAMLIDAGLKVHRFLGSDAAEQFEAHLATLNAHRADYALRT